MWKVWLRPSKTSEATRVRLYNCYILPILLYNWGTWALTKAELHGLESFHWQQLRKVIDIRYPDWISTDKLYRRTKTEPLRYTLLRSRWRRFGHILRRPANIPAYRFMDAYFRLSTAGKWLGRRHLTLPMVLDADLQTLSIGHKLQKNTRPLPTSAMRARSQGLETPRRGTTNARSDGRTLTERDG
ncbi:hypothetical protein ON010_g10405 [Phytophthora cinnamomi]|nr:hypothetical protein ON010_g10405 [Phytophthora cinnamomi]